MLRPQPRAWILLLAALLAAPAAGQRVQFPSTVQEPYPAPTTSTPQLGGFDPYNTSTLTPPTSSLPYNTTPSYAQPSYAQPGYAQPVYGQPTYAAPQTHTTTPPQSLYDSGTSPVGWQSGTYAYQNPDGSTVRLQRLLQQISFEHTWLYGASEPRELGINRTELAATFGVPIFYNPNTPLLITPGFAFNWLQGPGDLNATLPPRVYDAYLDFSWYPKLTDFLSADLGLRTGVWTDFQEINNDSVRILGRGMGVLSYTPKFDLLLGVWYLDRNDIRMLPAGGVHWRPTSDWDAYLVFPNPKVRRRARTLGTSQWYWYFAGEYGGGRWTIQRPGYGPDDIDINDIRVFFGLEWETLSQARGHVEVGYVFEREIIFDRTKSPEKYSLEDTIMLRAGVDF